VNEREQASCTSGRFTFAGAGEIDQLTLWLAAGQPKDLQTMNKLSTLSRPATLSLWAATAQTPELPPLRTSVDTDVCVVGAGIAGLTTAYLLSKNGHRVLVLDDGPIGGGQTELTSAHLSSVIDDRFSEVERIHGPEAARLAAESHAAAIDRIESIVLEEQIDCDFRRVDGYLFNPPDERGDVLDREFEAARRTGALEVERVARVPWPSFDTGPALRFGRQAQFHPLKYLAGLAQAILDRRGTIHCGTHVKSVAGGDQAKVETSDGKTVNAKHIVVATNTPINDRYAIHTKQAPYLTYVVGFRIPAGVVPPALYWDTADPYHYVRLQPTPDGTAQVLIVGGEDHKTGQGDDGQARFDRLEAWARQRFGQLSEVEFRWSGQVMETLDGLGFIGRNPLDEENVYIATGDSGMGLTHGTIAGILLTDLIAGHENPWTELYKPTRKPAAALRDFASENLNVAAQYASWLTPGEVSDAAEIVPGQGAILRRGLSKIAAYRDESGTLHELSAVCPHLKCILAWNSCDRTWDCPCHGSRFSATGDVLVGPSNVGLAKIGARSDAKAK
jgi:glycine/D-amino acid oxidase-like deaminating enzyme/nitrite reductase/ring-hydroxylating ferredoxin subunit